MELDPHTDAVEIIDPSGTSHRFGNPTGRYEFASVTKLITTHVIADGVQSGFGSFDDDVISEELMSAATLADVLSHASGIRPEGQPSIAPRTKRIYTNEAYDLAEKFFISMLGSGFDDENIGSIFEEGLNSSLATTITIDGSCAKSASGTFDDLATFCREIREPQFLDPHIHSELTRVHCDGLEGIVPGWGNYANNTWGIGYEIKGTKHPHWMGTLSSPHTYGHFGQSGAFVMHDPVNNISIASVSSESFGPWAKIAWPHMIDQIFQQYA
jgi:CubicO group peptidase (beta-lactamase class C family)